MVPKDPAEIRKSIGTGWWKYDLKAAEALLLKNGFKRDAKNMWLLPNGQPWKLAVLAEGETRPIMTRAASMIAENWKDFGIDPAWTSGTTRPGPGSAASASTMPTSRGLWKRGAAIRTCSSSSSPGIRPSTGRG